MSLPVPPPRDTNLDKFTVPSSSASPPNGSFSGYVMQLSLIGRQKTVRWPWLAFGASSGLSGLKMWKSTLTRPLSARDDLSHDWVDQGRAEVGLRRICGDTLCVPSRVVLRRATVKRQSTDHRGYVSAIRTFTSRRIPETRACPVDTIENSRSIFHTLATCPRPR